jgi:rRNA maturation protein Rpf1
MRKEKLIQIVDEGVKSGKCYLVVKIETTGNPGAEVIVNPAENFAAKLAYYLKAYNDDLELISAKTAGKSVRITDALMTSNLNDLNWFIY